MSKPKSKDATSASLREASRALGIPRPKLLRHIKAGLPVVRKGDRVFINVADARDWLALEDLGHGDGGQPAPALHPDDPRYQSKIAGMHLDWLKSVLAAGVAIPVDDALARHRDAMAGFRSALVRCHQEIGPDRVGDVADVEGEVSDVIERALAELRDGDWPTPRAVVPMPETPEPSPDQIYSARYLESDPRHAFHAAKAAKAEAAYKELRDSIIAVADVVQMTKRENDKIRKRLRKIPTAVALADPADSIAAHIEREIHTALCEFSGVPDDQQPMHAADFDLHDADMGTAVVGKPFWAKRHEESESASE